MTEQRTLDDIPDMQHEIARRKQPPDIRMHADGRIFEVVEWHGLEFKTPFDPHTIHE